MKAEAVLKNSPWGQTKEDQNQVDKESQKAPILFRRFPHGRGANRKRKVTSHAGTVDCVCLLMRFAFRLCGVAAARVRLTALENEYQR